MIRSTRRPVVYPQAVHARLAGTIAAAWGNDDFTRPALPFDSFVRGVALHDRGYGELDTEVLGAVPPERWLEIQHRGFAPLGDDPVIDLMVGLHVHRLVSGTTQAIEPGARSAVLAEMESALPRLRGAAGVTKADAAAVNDVTLVCDLVSLDFCFEEVDSGSREIVPRPGAAAVRLTHASDGEGRLTLSPWPLGLPWLAGVVVGFREDGYPHELDPIVEPFRLEPA